MLHANDVTGCFGLGSKSPYAYTDQFTVKSAHKGILRVYFCAFDETGVTMRYKDYRRAEPERQQVMTISADEFIRRFLLHVLPRGFHRIRHYGLLAASSRKASLALARQLLVSRHRRMIHPTSQRTIARHAPAVAVT